MKKSNRRASCDLYQLPIKESTKFDPLFSFQEESLRKECLYERIGAADLLFLSSSRTTREWIHSEAKGQCQLVWLRICIRRQTFQKVSGWIITSSFYFMKLKQFCKFWSPGAMWLQMPLHTYSELEQVWVSRSGPFKPYDPWTDALFSIWNPWKKKTIFSSQWNFCGSESQEVAYFSHIMPPRTHYW